MHIPWNDVQLFLAVVESGSVSGAAKHLKVTQPTVSRQLAELEARLGEGLFIRTVAGVTLTPFGERMLSPARQMAECARELERTIESADTRPRGTVRITAPPGVAYTFLTPLSRQLRKQLPEVQLEILATTSYLDLVRREADLALRMQAFDRVSAPRDLLCLATLEHGGGAYATREYRASLPRRYGLADVDWIGWAPPLEHLPPNPQLSARIAGFKPAFTSNDYILQLRAAEAGVGAIVCSDWRGRHDLPTPLVPLALPLGQLNSTLLLVASRGALAIARIKAVADIIAAEMTMRKGTSRR